MNLKRSFVFLIVITIFLTGFNLTSANAVSFAESVTVDKGIENITGSEQELSEPRPRNGSCGTNITWELDDNGTLTITGSGKITNYKHDVDNNKIYIPNPNDEEDMSAIAPFFDYDEIKKVIIGEGITSIGNYTFFGCDGIEEVVFPKSGFKRLGYGAFRKCSSLETLIIPDTVNFIGGHAFMDCVKLKKVNIPDGIKTLYNHTFYSCKSLTRINLPNGITVIENDVFNKCHELVEINIPETVTEIGDQAFRECKSLKEIHIPDGVTSVGRFLFKSCQSLETANIPTGISSVAYAMFSSCASLKDITIPDNITKIEDSGFYECASLREVTLPDSVQEIERYAFGRSGVTKINIPDGVTVIPEYLLYDAHNLESIDIPDSVQSFEKSAFTRCYNLKTIQIPEGVEYLPNNLFYECYTLKDVVIPDSVKEMGNHVFYGCKSITHLILPKELKKIGKSCFAMLANLKEIEVPAGVTELPQRTFQSCDNLKKVILPGSIESIGEKAFRACISLEEISMPESLEHIGAEAFALCNLQELALPDCVQNIEAMAFFCNREIKEIRIPEGIDSIKGYTFAGCTGITEITIPDNINTIYDYAFESCTGLNRVTITSKTTVIENLAFTLCENLFIVNKDSYAEQYVKSNNMLYAYLDGTDEENSVKNTIFSDGMNFEWEFNKLTGHLALSGNGDFPEYDTDTVPWKDYQKYIKSVSIAGAINKFGNNLFSGAANIDKIMIYNKNCDISNLTFDNKNLKVYAYYDSLAEKFSETNGYYFVPIDKTHVHEFGDDITTVESTCTEQGSITYTCKLCLNVVTQNLPLNEHVYGEWIIKNKPSCLQNGLQYRICKNCYHKAEETLPKTDHIEYIIPGKDPSCTKPGYTAQSFCKTCGTLISKSESVPATGHEASNEWRSDATNHWHVCNICQDVIETETHILVENVTIHPGCDTLGTAEYSCQICDYTEIKDIPATGHELVSHKAKAATCTKSGYKAYKTCNSCDYTTYQKVTAKGHKWKNSYTIDKKATTAAAGSKSKHCAICNAINSGSKVTIAKIKKITTNTLVYNGKKRTDNVTVINANGKKLVKGTDFTVTYKNSKGKTVTPKVVGSYTAVIKFNGNYSGTITKSFNINPQTTAITKWSKTGKNQITVKWTKKTSEVTGYQIRYSTKQDMSNAKTSTVTKNSTSSKTINKLIVKKKYYVQIRTYKTVNGKKYFSAWSNKKTITIK